MLTMREVDADGFGVKVRDWNRTELVEQWRERWADRVNQRLAELDIDARIDHRGLEAQGIGLEPQDKIGPAASRMEGRGLEAERIEEHRAIAERNGARIIADPAIALDAITHQQATFRMTSPISRNLFARLAVSAARIWPATMRVSIPRRPLPSDAG
jgi:ATP-dependent exoDNAse (exonuclease V) alpha subunit